MRATVLFAVLSAASLVYSFGGAFDNSFFNEEQIYIILSLDSFTPSYFERRITPNMEVFRNMGCYAKSMKPRFPTKTFVNHHSLATGCNAGSHGVTQNEVYDSLQGILKYSYELFHYNASCTPLCTVAEQNGIPCGCMMWPGCDFPYNNVYPSHFQKLTENMSWYERICTVCDWIEDDIRPARLIMWYLEQPDSEGHAFNHTSPQENYMISEVDYFVGVLQQILMTKPYWNRVNLIVVSDHGMTTCKMTDIINLNEFMTMKNSYKIVGTSPCLQIIPQEGHLDRLKAELKAGAEKNGHFKVYTNDDVEDRWKVKNDRRLGPLLAVADLGYCFQDLNDMGAWFAQSRGIPNNTESSYGVHGYDNDLEPMQAIFMAKGPMFKSGQVLEPFDNIDLFPLMCYLLDLSTPPTEGSDRSDIWNSLLKSGVDAQAMSFYMKK